MKRALLCAIAMMGCEAGIQLHPPVPGVSLGATVAPGTTVATPPEGAPAGEAQPAAVAGPSCQGDAHCLTDQDILVCEQSWYCYVGHTMQQPSDQTKMQGQFIMVPDGKQMWTDRWYVTRPLQQGEQLRLGQPILFFDSNGHDGLLYPPQNHEQAIKGTWLTARVTDLSDLFKGAVHTNSGNRTVHISDIRVITSAGTQKVEYDQ